MSGSDLTTTTVAATAPATTSAEANTPTVCIEFLPARRRHTRMRDRGLECAAVTGHLAAVTGTSTLTRGPTPTGMGRSARKRWVPPKSLRRLTQHPHIVDRANPEIRLGHSRSADLPLEAFAGGEVLDGLFRLPGFDDHEAVVGRNADVVQESGGRVGLDELSGGLVVLLERAAADGRDHVHVRVLHANPLSSRNGVSRPTRPWRGGESCEWRTPVPRSSRCRGVVGAPRPGVCLTWISTSFPLCAEHFGSTGSLPRSAYRRFRPQNVERRTSGGTAQRE